MSSPQNVVDNQRLLKLDSNYINTARNIIISTYVYIHMYVLHILKYNQRPHNDHIQRHTYYVIINCKFIQ